MIVSFPQRDPQWAALKISPSDLTIGRFGCVITALASMSAGFGDNLTPPEVADKCKFTDGGLIIWQFCDFSSFEWVHREYFRNDRKIGPALSDANRAVLLQVNEGAHWVLGLGYDKMRESYVIADPWFGDMCVMSRYKNSITGASYFRRK